MKKIITFCLFCFFFTPSIVSAHSVALITPVNEPVPAEVLLKKIGSLKIKDLQKLTGRKFTLREKIAFLILKKKLRHAPEGSTSQGKTALILGIVAVGSFLLGFFVPVLFLGSIGTAVAAIAVGSSAKKKNPGDRNASTGKLLGWLALGLIAVLAILVVVLLSSLTWGWE